MLFSYQGTVAAGYNVRMWFEALCPAFANPRQSRCPVEKCMLPVDPVLQAVCCAPPNLSVADLSVKSLAI